MSWSVTFIGLRDNVVRALEENSNKLDGQSKVEYDAAVPHFIGLVRVRVDCPYCGLQGVGH